MKRREVVAIIGVLLGTPVLLTTGYFAWYWSLVAVNPVEGSPELASQWAKELSGYADPQTALAANPKIIIVNCPNGD